MGIKIVTSLSLERFGIFLCAKSKPQITSYVSNPKRPPLPFTCMPSLPYCVVTAVHSVHTRISKSRGDARTDSDAACLLSPHFFFVSFFRLRHHHHKKEINL